MTILQTVEYALDNVDTRSRYKSCDPGDQRPSVRGDVLLHHPALWTGPGPLQPFMWKFSLVPPQLTMLGQCRSQHRILQTINNFRDYL